MYNLHLSNQEALNKNINLICSLSDNLENLRFLNKDEKKNICSALEIINSQKDIQLSRELTNPMIKVIGYQEHGLIGRVIRFARSIIVKVCDKELISKINETKRNLERFQRDQMNLNVNK